MQYLLLYCSAGQRGTLILLTRREKAKTHPQHQGKVPAYTRRTDPWPLAPASQKIDKSTMTTPTTFWRLAGVSYVQVSQYIYGLRFVVA